MPDMQQKPSTRTTNPVPVFTGNALDGLATNAGAVTAGIVDNIDELDLFGDFELNVTFAAAPTDGQQIELYLVTSIDGTNFATHTTGASAIGPKTGYAGSFIVTGTGTAQRLPLNDVELPIRDFKDR